MSKTEKIKKRSVHSLFFLTGRNLLIQALSFFGFFFLSVYLGQEEVGLFFAVSEIVAILGYFSDIGLAAALIQNKKKPKIRDIRTTFTIQQALVLSLLFVVFLLSPVIKRSNNLDSDGLLLLFALCLGFFTSSLKTIPSVLLERSLRFDILSLVDFSETLAFNALAVFFAWKGWGVRSYVIAIVVRSLLGTLLIYALKPWPIGLAFSKKSLKKLFRFGIPYQVNSLLATVKDRFSNVFMWKIVGSQGLGITAWAQKWSQLPLRFLMDAVMRVTFPSFSRLQKNKKLLKSAIEKSLFFLSLFVFPTLLLLLFLIFDLVHIIPKYEKWRPALFALAAYSLNSAFAALSTPLTNALNAVGKIKITLKLMLLWTTLAWTILPLLALKWGYNGIAFFQIITALTSLLVFSLARKHLAVSVFSCTKIPIFASLTLFLVLALAHSLLFAHPLLNILVKLGLSLLIYPPLIFVFAQKELVWFKNTLIQCLKKD